MSARFAGEIGQCFGVDGLIEESKTGGAEEAVALCVDFSHQHVVLTWEIYRERKKFVKISKVVMSFENVMQCTMSVDEYK